MSSDAEIILSAGNQFYAVIDSGRECALWLSLERYPLPVPKEWRRPGATCACVMRGRNYYRLATLGPQHTNVTKAIAADDELIRDYRDAAWWTPSLQEAWAELDREAGRPQMKKTAALIQEQP